MRGLKAFLLFVVLVTAIPGWTCAKVPTTVKEILDGVKARPELVENGHSLEPPQIIKVTDGVYQAFGYALANSIMIEGPTGLIIVDTTECLPCARQIMMEFRKISSKRIEAIVFTHFHQDHHYGAEAFIEDKQNPPDIWSHELFPQQTKEMIVTGPKTMRGSTHQFGFYLGDQVLSDGIGRKASFAPVSPLAPTRLVQGNEAHVNIAGLNVTFLHIPGETKDQLGVWFPDKRVLCPADDIYRTFPNLYAIRGTPPRNVLEWHDSLAKMRKLEAEFLVPSHTRPVIGQDEIRDLLTVYMSGIQFVHDQTVRQLNKGTHPDEISQAVILPQSLNSHPYLLQFYGTTPWASKAVYENYIGWFSGDVVELIPFTPLKRSKHMLDMMGKFRLLRKAESALNNSDPQWALELSSHVFRVYPDDIEARDVRLRALQALASLQTNPLARNFYLTAALDDHKFINWGAITVADLSKLDIMGLLNLKKYKLKAEETEGVNTTLVICSDDTQEAFIVQIVYSVLIVDQLDHESCDDNTASYNAKIKTGSVTLRDILSNKLSASDAIRSGQATIEGSLTSLEQFLSYFESN